MGADLYIMPLYKKQVEAMTPAWEEAVRERDAAAALLPGRLASEVIHSICFGFPAPSEERLTQTEKENIQKLREAQEKVLKVSAEKDADVYFRDSYNDTSLFWVINLDFYDRLTKNGELPPKKAKILLEEVKTSTITLGKAHAEGKEEWEKYFTDKKQAFIHFLELAIESNLPITCSM